MTLPDQNSQNDRILPKIASAVNVKRRNSTFNRENPGGPDKNADKHTDKIPVRRPQQEGNPPIAKEK